MPTQINVSNTAPHTTFILDTGSGPNIIKENFVPNDITVNYTNILKLNGIRYNDFFKQTSSKIDYAIGYLDVS